MTYPADGQENVALDADIMVYLSPGIDTASATFSLTPDAAPYTTNWNPSQTILVIMHSTFQMCTIYTVELVGGGLVPGPVPNPWSFTTTCPGATFMDVADIKGFSGIGGSFFAWGDYNRDGYEDLLINGKRLFRNNGPPNYDFTEATSEAGIGGTTVNNGVWGDYDNDGWLDFYGPGGGWSTTASPNAPWDILWRNNGDGTFTNVTAAAGYVKDIYPSVAAGWGDYDRDGFIDLYVANYENAGMTGYYPDFLWRNNGDGTFTDATGSANIQDSGMNAKPGRGVAWGDYNNDGWLDAYISNYRITANYLWKNNGDGTFTDTAPGLNASGWFQTSDLCYDFFAGSRYGQYYWGMTWGHTIGSAWSDFDNDGDIDIFTANLAHKHVGNTTWPTLPYDMRGYITEDSRFYRNEGPPFYNFTDIRGAANIPFKPIGTPDPGLIDSPFAPCLHATYIGDELFGNVMWYDYDLDGWQDMWLVQVYDLSYSYSYLYHNNGDGTFHEVSEPANVRVWSGGYAGAWADYNDDGWPDLVTNGEYPTDGSPSNLRLFENQGTTNSWLKVKLNGCTDNIAAIGARITATGGGLTQMRNIEAGSGSHSQMNSLVQHFGFGSYRGTVDLNIRWPDGLTEVMSGVALNQTLKVQQVGCSIPDRVSYVTADLSTGSGSDVVISWTKVMGDDGWLTNVSAYAVYYGTTYDAMAASYQYLGEVPAGTTSFTHIGGGIGDMNTYYYAVQVNGTRGGTTRSFAQAVKFAKSLATGEQLVSIPIPIVDYSIDSVLRGVSYDHIRVFDQGVADPWLSYSPSRLYNDFDAFAPYQAFWIGVTSDGWFTVAGPILQTATIDLQPGWNLVGLPSTLPRTMANAVAGLGGNLRAIEGNDPSAGPYFLKRFGPTDTMFGGEGYWLYVGSAAIWAVSFQP